MKHISIILLFAVILSSCYTQRAALRDLNKIKVHHPDLIEELSDTIIQVWEVTKEVPIPADTISAEWGWDWTKVDTFYQTVSDSVVITKIRLIRDTIINVSVQTEVFPDTIKIYVTDTIKTIVTKTEYTTQVDTKIPWTNRILMGILALGLLLLIIFLLRRKKETA